MVFGAMGEIWLLWYSINTNAIFDWKIKGSFQFLVGQMPSIFLFKMHLDAYGMLMGLSIGLIVYIILLTFKVRKLCLKARLYSQCLF